MIPTKLAEEAVELIEELMFSYPDDYGDDEIIDRAEDLLKRMREEMYGTEEEGTDTEMEIDGQGVSIQKVGTSSMGRKSK